MEKKDNEQIKAEINRLYKLYNERDKEFESAKLKRFMLTIIGFAIVIFLVMYQISEPSGWEILQVIVISIILSGFHCFINGCIFGALAYKGRDEGDCLRNIKERITRLEKELRQ